MVGRGVVVVVSVVRWMSCLSCRRDLLGTERLESQCALTRSGVLRARRELCFGPRWLAFFVCHSLLIEMRRLAAGFSCHHAALMHAGIVIVCDCWMYAQHLHPGQRILLIRRYTDIISLSTGPDSARHTAYRCIYSDQGHTARLAPPPREPWTIFRSAVA